MQCLEQLAFNLTRKFLPFCTAKSFVSKLVSCKPVAYKKFHARICGGSSKFLKVVIEGFKISRGGDDYRESVHENV